MAQRISKSSIDWAKFAQMVSKYEKSDFIAFKGKSESYLRSVLDNPEKPPSIDWNSFKALVGDKSLIDRLEKSYNAYAVPYPKTNLSQSVDAQQRFVTAKYKARIQNNLQAIEEAKEMMEKFKIMVPFHDMTFEEFAMTFPKWAHWYGSKTLPGQPDCDSRLTDKERAEILKPDGRPWSAY